MPILEGTGNKPRFFGALCHDIQLTDNTKYFDKNVETKRFIFKEDEKFNQAV